MDRVGSWGGGGESLAKKMIEGKITYTEIQQICSFFSKLMKNLKTH